LSTSFGQFNEDLIRALIGARGVIERKAILSQQAARLLEEGGHLLHFLPLNFVFDENDCAELATSASTLINVQTRILNHLVQSVGREETLRLFRVPPAMQRFVNWEELLNPTYLVARLDIIQSESGYHFCEFNIDSCVAAAEIFEFAEDYFNELNVSVQDVLGRRPPLKTFGTFIAEAARRRNAARIVILDWSVGGGSAGKGYLSFERMRRHVAREAAPLPVFIADEKSYHPEWLTPAEARRTLVHRGFMMDEMDDGGAFLDRLLQLGTPVVNTYESEIRMNKIWFALFHDNQTSQILTQHERDLIRRYIPYTSELNPQNVSEFIKHKDHYIFKAKQSFGGQGIRLGEEASDEELKELLSEDNVSGWIAQKLVDVLPTTFPHNESFSDESQNLVFGMYLYGSQADGMLVRASRRSKIVNVTAGDAKLAWAICANEATKAAMVSRLREGSSAGQ